MSKVGNQFCVTESAQAKIAAFFKEYSPRQPIRVFLFRNGRNGPRPAMALDRVKDGDAVYVLSDIEYVIDRELLEKAGAVEIDYGKTGFEISFSGCGGEAPVNFSADG